MIMDGHKAISALGPPDNLRIHGVVQMDHVWAELLPDRFQAGGTRLPIGETFRDTYRAAGDSSTVCFPHGKCDLASFLLELVNNREQMEVGPPTRTQSVIYV